MHFDRLPGKGHIQDVSPGVDQGTADFDGRRNHGLHVHLFHLEVDPAVAHARYVEQVVNQPGQLLDLAVDHLGELLNLRIGPAFHAEDLHGVADRGKRVAQLVPQHRQELILPPSRILELVVEPGILLHQGGTVSQVLGRRQVCRRRQIAQPCHAVLARAAVLRMKLKRGRRSVFVVTWRI